MSLEMPLVRSEILERESEIVSDLESILVEGVVISETSEKCMFDTDGLTMYRELPLVVVLPSNREEVIEVLRYCSLKDLNLVTRGAGTGLTGGALPLRDGVLLVLTKLDSILEIDSENLQARVEAGVTNLSISEAVKGEGLFYAPDPSSQISCSIGGNVAENSGGAHCLKYGVTTNNVLGMEVVLFGGEVLKLGGKGMSLDDWDLMGVITGSEGSLGVVTEVTVRLLPVPEYARAILIGFDNVRESAECIERVMSCGLTPACMEFMDKMTIEACESFSEAGYPLDVEALMIIEFDGTEAEVNADIERMKELSSDFNFKHFKVSSSEAEREKIWRGRKGAFSAIGRIKPNYLTMDGTISRGKLAESLEKIGKLSEEYDLEVANVFHAGDGNMHPLILFDSNKSGDREKAVELAMETLKISVEAGGVISGEHGIGIEKRDSMGLMFSQEDLDHQLAYKRAFDQNWRMNPGKVFPLSSVDRFREIYK